MGNCEGACSVGAKHDSDLFSMQAQEGTVSNLVCYNKAFSTTTTDKMLCFCYVKIETAIRTMHKESI